MHEAIIIMMFLIKMDSWETIYSFRYVYNLSRVIELYLNMNHVRLIVNEKRFWPIVSYVIESGIFDVFNRGLYKNSWGSVVDGEELWNKMKEFGLPDNVECSAKDAFQIMLFCCANPDFKSNWEIYAQNHGIKKEWPFLPKGMRELYGDQVARDMINAVFSKDM